MLPCLQWFFTVCNSPLSLLPQVLLKALERLEGVEGVAHIIDPKAISKEDLYGVLDPNTREWTDGLFTHILRKYVDNLWGPVVIAF